MKIHNDSGDNSNNNSTNEKNWAPASNTNSKNHEKSQKKNEQEEQTKMPWYIRRPSLAFSDVAFMWTFLLDYSIQLIFNFRFSISKTGCIEECLTFSFALFFLLSSPAHQKISTRNIFFGVPFSFFFLSLSFFVLTFSPSFYYPFFLRLLLLVRDTPRAFGEIGVCCAFVNVLYRKKNSISNDDKTLFVTRKGLLFDTSFFYANAECNIRLIDFSSFSASVQILINTFFTPYSIQ